MDDGDATAAAAAAKQCSAPIRTFPPWGKFSLFPLSLPSSLLSLPASALGGPSSLPSVVASSSFLPFFTGIFLFPRGDCFLRAYRASPLLSHFFLLSNQIRTEKMDRHIHEVANHPCRSRTSYALRHDDVIRTRRQLLSFRS